MKTIKRIAHYRQSPGEVFALLDDLTVTGMHMTKSSMAMMGSKLDLNFLSDQRKGVNTKFRWTGTMMWLKMDFTVLVTKWVEGKEKVWETVGDAKMIIYSWYRMNLLVSPDENNTNAELSITYERPRGFINKILSFFLADVYCRWCLKNMLNDTGKLLENGAQTANRAYEPHAAHEPHGA
jgi:hypothetical protein